MHRFAVGLVCGTALFLGCTPPAPSTTTPPKPAGNAAPTSGTTTSAVAAPTGVKLVSLDVPDMHCPFACYPKVKETLESQPGVEEVTLAKQKEEGIIDNPQVLVKLNGNFDPNSAIAALKQSGFTGKLADQK